jgi:hypothetical protein
MAEEKGFLARWSTRKRAARESDPPVEPDTPPMEAVEPAEPEVQPEPEPSESEPPEIDPQDLPPLESIRTGADVRVFLQRGVPKALRQAALRRLWSADPAIRDFREVADYDWDFNAPGYGALLPKDDPKAAAEKLFAAMRRRVTTSAEASAPPPASEPEPVPAIEPGVSRAPAAEPSVEPEPAAPGTAAAPVGAPAQVRRRRHGAATPS